MFGAIAWGALGGTQLDHENTKSIPMQRGARSVLRGSVPMQRGAHFLILGYRSMVQHGLSEGIKNMCKTRVSLHILKADRKKGAPGAAAIKTNLHILFDKMNTLSIRYGRSLAPT